MNGLTEILPALAIPLAVLFAAVFCPPRPEGADRWRRRRRDQAVTADTAEPIRPEHAEGGWGLAGNPPRYLIKHAYGFRLRVTSSGAKACAWLVTRDNRFVRQDSARSVAEAKQRAETWARLHSTTQL
ncbi:hypothetical protein [Nocardia sp. alder85J]|uniref:hypothetical protein n=1 Tax=Nocardia sp. alder85J TaxID=2862949 RepID=UPI001CD663B7|nr:hypothetical protein [Nocardia sp. alder85J]MCX4094435.1 hypothetical protein [Nocardia sp. alder85J]